MLEIQGAGLLPLLLFWHKSHVTLTFLRKEGSLGVLIQSLCITGSRFGLKINSVLVSSDSSLLFQQPSSVVIACTDHKHHHLFQSDAVVGLCLVKSTARVPLFSLWWNIFYAFSENFNCIILQRLQHIDTRYKQLQHILFITSTSMASKTEYRVAMLSLYIYDSRHPC